MSNTSIQWTDATWNPLRGCTEISPGCAHCYAAVLAARFSGPGQPYEGLAYFDANHKAHWTGRVRLAEDKLGEPIRWRKPRRVFVNSMSDLFHTDVPDEWIDRIFRVMGATPDHTYQVLTKRADRMADYCIARWDSTHQNSIWHPLSNVWLGVSVEDQKRADERIPHLIRCPAAVRFLLVEPMLGPIDLTAIGEGDQRGLDSLTGEFRYYREHDGEPCSEWGPSVHWVICGGESGPHARPFDLAWARDLRDQCQAAGVVYFLKQLGTKPITKGHPICLVDRSGPHAPVGVDIRDLKLKDSHGGDQSEWPDDLKNCREFPR